MKFLFFASAFGTRVPENDLKDLKDLKASDDFGIVHVECGEYFRPGAEWILQDQFPIGNTVRLCQNREGEDHQFATLFDVTTRTPIYSAGKFMRDPNLGTNERPTSNWHHVSLALCLDEDTDLKEVWNKSFYSNIGSTYSRYYDYCNTFQAIDEDYKGNTGDLNIDRGHLLPNGIVNQDEISQKTTFTLTNVCAQHSRFNQQAWNQLECMVRKYLEREIPRQYAYIITGTHGTKLTMNEDNDEKKSVRMPASYWKAFCHDDGNRVYAWVYSQINENDQTQSSGDYMMSPNEFSELYYDGAPIFDNECQNAGMGPWLIISEEWATYKSRYGC